MKKMLLVILAVLIGLPAGTAALAQQITQSIPEEDRIRSVEVVEVTKKVKDAKKVVEEKGEKAFAVFTENEEEWLGSEQALYIIEATEGATDEGRFVLYPDVDNVGKNAIDMSRVNGRHFARKAVKHHKEQAGAVWYGFVAGEAGDVPHAKTVVILPTGRVYVIAAGSHNLELEKHFLVDLVGAACDLVAKDGEGAFQSFRGMDSPFRFKDTYLYIVDKDGNMLLDPGRPEYEGKNLVDFPSLFPGYKHAVVGATMEEAIKNAESGLFPKIDADYVKNRNDLLLKNGDGWFAYFTPKPGAEKMSKKVSYEKVVTGPDGKVYVIGSGAYLAD